jgi:exodeoxyribonuclease V beta subunit
VTVVRYPRPQALPAASDRFLVVEASAGTGKTFFLEHRVVDLILAGARLDEILVVTFTDKAVAELRLRVRDLIDRMSRATESTTGDSHWELDDDARTRLRAAVNAFDRAPIFTIHGFCHRVLVEDAFAARRPLQQEQIADEVAFDSAFRALLAERFATAEPDRSLLAAYVENDKTVDQLRDMLLAASRSTGKPPRAYDRAAVASLGERMRAALADPEALAAALPLKGNDKHNVPRWLHNIARDLRGSEDNPARVLVVCHDHDQYLEKLSVKAKQWAGHAAFGEVMGEASQAMRIEEALAAQMLPALAERSGANKSERGQYDYDDMLRLVLEALRGDRGAEIAARLRARTPWVLIDEFQDTDPVQWQIFRTVWLHDDSRGLAIVGDPKQAIYSFRGADVKTYLAAREELKALGAKLVVLDTNHRSTEQLVAAVNAILLAGAPITMLLEGTIRYEHPVQASGDVRADHKRPPVTIFSLSGSNKREDHRDAHAQAIGAEIERLRDTAPSWTCRGETRGFSLAQVMVLTRANKESLAIAAALRGRGLPCELRESDRLFDTREAHELAAVLAAIAAPRDRSARMRALRTRFFDVPWEDLMRVVDAPDHDPAIARIHEWAALASRRAYEPLFRRLVEDSRFAERSLVLGSGERALVNTWHLVELLLEEVARSRCDLHELVVQLRRWIADEVDQPGERDVQRVETDADAIRILTIHKAKGLEAPYVFVYGAASRPPRAKVPWQDGDDDGENQRLAYVALTRAQLRLYLPRYTDKVCDDHSTYAQIQRCLPAAIGSAPKLFETIDVAVPAPPIAEPPADALAGLDVPAPPVVAELAALVPARAGLAMLSYTRLARELEAARIEPARVTDAIAGGASTLAVERAELDASFDAPGDAEVADDELPPGLDSGLFLHDVLEHVDVDGIRRAPDAAAWAADPDVRALLADHARVRGISDVYLPHAARIVHATLTQPLALAGGDTLPPLASARAFAREIEFAYPIPDAPERGLVKGFVDVLVAWDDELWVLDYKSDLLRDPSDARAHVDEHYALQARLYAIAADRVRGARRLAGLLFTFVRHGVTVAIRTPEDRLAAWTTWLGGLVEAAP